jgi:hypothetical protein
MEQSGTAAADHPDGLLRLSTIYRKLDGLGLCDQVRCFFLRGRDGSAGSLIVADRNRFLLRLLASGRFCRDSHGGGILHSGRISFREIAPESGDALHFAFGPGDHVWVHVDRVSPTAGAQGDGRCRYERKRAAAHIRRDVVPILLAARDRPPRGPGRRRRAGRRSDLERR